MMRVSHIQTITISILCTCASTIFQSCAENNDGLHNQHWKDSLQLTLSEDVDSMVNSTIRNSMFEDTLNLGSAPVVVISARPVSKEYSSYKDVSLTYKNVSGKKISAIKFQWYGENAFHKPADCGVLSNGFGGGFMDEGLGIGRTASGTWNILSRDLKKIIKAWPTEVAFDDGTNWTVKKR